MNDMQKGNTIDISNAVVFATVIKTPEQGANSTHIMTMNLLHGIKKVGKRICMLVILEDTADREKIQQYFQSRIDEIVFLPSHYKKKIKTRYEHLLRVFSTMVLPNHYEGHLAKFSFMGEPELIISNAPTFEAILCGKAMKKLFPNVKYYQYWSDPITLSGITPDDYSMKRFIHRWAEAKAIDSADRVIYGTKTLMDFQKQLFQKYADKMRYIDVSYTEAEDDDLSAGSLKRLLYAGNFHKNIRNIQPLVDALANLPDYHLDIYGDGECKAETCNVCLHGRVSPKELEEIERNYGISVCILNHSCIQIPGKIFYRMNRPGVILIISDGKYASDLLEYLNSYGRFFVCENTREEIEKMLMKLSDSDKSVYSVEVERYSPKNIAKDLLNGGRD